MELTKERIEEARQRQADTLQQLRVRDMELGEQATKIKEQAEGNLAAIHKTRQQILADYNATDGAIKAFDAMLAELDKPEPEDPAGDDPAEPAEPPKALGLAKTKKG